MCEAYMFAETIPIDRSGRITLPKRVLDALGVSTKDFDQIPFLNRIDPVAYVSAS
jgi:bifunctional DNA-binding transcriptional regulator/antitoxin component of YhaV-PrlF toxin-antitoxin module